MKLTAKDLRIGNFIMDSQVNGNNSLRVDAIFENTVRAEIDRYVYFDEIRPIPLTEEWLLKFGFKENYSSYKIDNNKYLLELHYYDCWNLTYIEKPKYGESSAELSGYWNLHELQNLFFVLTGEELTYENN